MNQNHFLKSTFILTLATAVSKILGFVYIIPFTALVGMEHYILFEYAYKPYALLISFSTIGLPLAVSKFVSKYNELGDYRTSQKLFKTGLFLMVVTGFLSFLTLYFFSPTIATLLIDPTDLTGNSMDDVIFVMRMVSFALLIVPSLALIRGFLQGHHDMKPTAYSQVIEQFIRIVFILVGSYLLITFFDGTKVQAVALSTFSAFIGALFGLFILIGYVKKNKQNQLKKESVESDINLLTIYKELLGYAIPFVIVSLALPVYQTIDTFMLNKTLMSIGYIQEDAEVMNSALSLVHKIIFIPVSLATAFSLTLVPSITKNFTSRDFTSMKNQINKTFSIILFFTLPIIFLFISFDELTFGFLFGTTYVDSGSLILKWLAPSTLLFSLFVVSSSILQGINKQKWAVYSFLIGFIAKLSLNYLFIVQFETVGTILTTNIGLMLSILINIIIIKKTILFKMRSNRHLYLTIIRSNLIPFIICLALKYIFSITYTLSFFNNLVLMSLMYLLTFVIYFAITIKNNAFFIVLGDNKLTKPFKRFKKE